MGIFLERLFMGNFLVVLKESWDEFRITWKFVRKYFLTISDSLPSFCQSETEHNISYPLALLCNAKK